jgi:integrase
MVNRLHVLDIATIAAAEDGVLNDGGALDGCVLEIHKRNGGKSKRAYFRYNGTPFGEKRTERLALGPYDLGLTHLRRMRVTCERLIEEGKSPRRYYDVEQEKQRTAGMTLRQAVAEHFEWAMRTVWNSPHSRSNNEDYRRLYLEPADIMNLPLDAIRVHHLDAFLAPFWKYHGGTGAHLRSLLHGAFQLQIDNEVFTKSNPLAWRKTSPLSRRLGKPMAATHFPGPTWQELPYIVAELWTQPVLPDCLTVTEIGHAYDLPQSNIRRMIRLGRFEGMQQKHPNRPGRTGPNFIPIAIVQKVLGEFAHDPVRNISAYQQLCKQALLALIFTAVRVNNICGQQLGNIHSKQHRTSELIGGLRWRNIKEDENYLEYLPMRKDPSSGSNILPSEHKLGWKFPVPYLVMLTDNLRAIIDEQREQQIHDGIKIELDGFVFQRPWTLTGENTGFGNPLLGTSLNNHLGLINEKLFERGVTTIKNITPHGLRTTFTTWAKENGYSDDLINLTLGHIIPAIRDNPTNWSYFYKVQLLEDRRKMMAHWEQHCLSKCGDAAADNILHFPASA